MRECILVLFGHALTLLRRWMERSMRSEPATRRVSTVATDHVGVSASDRISPSSETAAELSTLAISSPACTRKTKADAAAGSPSILPPSPQDQPHLRVSHWNRCHGRTEVALGGSSAQG